MRTAALFTALLISQIGGAAVRSPFDVGDRAQLFVDRVLVQSTDRVWFTQHPATKHPENPLIVADRPWEGWRLALYGTAMYDEQEGIFKMWYWAQCGGALYATSADGVHWDKPLVGTVDYQGGREHNIVLLGLHCPSVMKDLDDPDPARRYKMVCYRSGYHTFVSPDGLSWTALSGEVPIEPHGDVISAYRDGRLGLWVAFPKIMTQLRGSNRRVFYSMTSTDFGTWTEPVPAIVPDVRDDALAAFKAERVRGMLDVPVDPVALRAEIYGMGAYAHESCTLAFPWVMTATGKPRYVNLEGPSELQLACSRDLVSWERHFREPIVPPGAPGEWDSGWFYCASEAIRYGDEVRLYYAGANFTHGNPILRREAFDDGTPTGRGDPYTCSIGLATWPLDRFVSVDAGTDAGTLTSVPVSFTGERLVLNAASHGDGAIEVELLDLSGEVLARSEAVRGDHLRHAVQWQGAVDLAALAGQPVMLRFRMRQAELYSFAFRGPEGA